MGRDGGRCTDRLLVGGVGVLQPRPERPVVPGAVQLLGLRRREAQVFQKYSAGSLLKSERDELSAGVSMTSSVTSVG